jgi:hypothetical protein
MSNNNLPLNGSHALPQASSIREEDIKRLAEQILLSIPLYKDDYPIFIINMKDYVIIDNIHEFVTKKPKTYAGFLHVKKCEYATDYTITDYISNALRDIVSAHTEMTKYTVGFEAYNDTIFFGNTTEEIRVYKTYSDYDFINEESASALASYYMTRLRAKYYDLAKDVKSQVFMRYGHYNLEFSIKMAFPSENFLNLLQKIIDHAHPKTRKEQIEEEISRKNEEIKRLQAEIKRIKIKIKELEAEKEKSSQEIPISEKRITSVMKEIEQRTSYQSSFRGGYNVQ